MDILDIIRSGSERVCVFMKSGPVYETADGARFSPEEPYQMMNAVAAQTLILDIPTRFRLADKEEVKKFYSKEKKPIGPKRMTMV